MKLFSASGVLHPPLFSFSFLVSDDVEKSTVSHTVLTCSKQHLHNKKRRPSREHRCDAGQIPSKCQVRTFYNSRVLELGEIMCTLVSESLGAFIVIKD